MQYRVMQYVDIASPDRVYKKRAGQKFFLMLIPEK